MICLFLSWSQIDGPLLKCEADSAPHSQSLILYDDLLLLIPRAMYWSPHLFYALHFSHILFIADMVEKACRLSHHSPFAEEQDINELLILLNLIRKGGPEGKR